MSFFDRHTARDILDALRVLEGKIRYTGRDLSPGALELRRLAEESLRVTSGHLPHDPDDVTDDGPVLALLTIEDVADRLQVSVSTVRRLVKDGALETVHIGRSARVRPTDLENYIANLNTKDAA